MRCPRKSRGSRVERGAPQGRATHRPLRRNSSMDRRGSAFLVLKGGAAGVARSQMAAHLAKTPWKFRSDR